MVEATKQNVIYSVPPILNFSIQRFRSGKRNDAVVGFPIKGLDMSKYLKNDYIKYKEGELIYDLYGIVNQSGTLSFGHYTSYCLNEPSQKWYHFNDSTVSELEPDLL